MKIDVVRIVLFFLATSVSGCKAIQNSSSSTKDIITITTDGNNLAILYYITTPDGSTPGGDEDIVVRKQCGKLNAEFDVQGLSGNNYREKCKGPGKTLALSDFTTRWDAQFKALKKQNTISLNEARLRAVILSSMRKAKNANEGDTIPVPLNFDNPVNRMAYSYWYEALERVTRPDGGSSPNDSNDTPTPQTPPSTGSSYYSGTIAQPNNARGPFTVLLPLTRPLASRQVLVSVVPVTTTERCDVSTIGLFIQASRTAASNDEELVRSLTQANTFNIVNIRNGLDQIRLHIINPSGIAFNCRITVADAPSSQMPRNLSDERDKVMRAEFGQRAHRLAHYMWHASRNSYARPTTTALDRRNIDQMGWTPPRPILYGQNGATDFERTAATGAGEDFLYMHRIMIDQLRAAIEAKGLRMYDSWKLIPRPQDPDFPLRVSSIETSDQSEEGYRRIARLEQNYQSQSIGDFSTLSQLGTYLEMTVHNALHTRWSAPLSGARPVQDDPVTRNSVTRANWVWDDESYDHLSDTYAAHVNPIFWRIHGWVDDRINEWLKAKNLDVVSLDCSKETGRRCIQWRRDVWVGPPHVENLLNLQLTAGGDDSLENTLTILSENSFHSQLLDVSSWQDDKENRWR